MTEQQDNWARAALATLAMLGLLLLMELVNRSIGQIPTPGALALLFVAFVSFVVGTRAGVMAAYLCLAYGLWLYLGSAKPDEHVRLALLAILAPIAGILPARLARSRQRIEAVLMAGNQSLIEEVRTLEKQKAELARLATTDALSGLMNRRAFIEVAAATVARTDGHPTALLIVDIDRFKAINERFGRIAGDVVIAAIGELLRERFLVVGRLGGEEFSVLISACSLKCAFEHAESVRVAVERLGLGSPDEPVTVSIGVAVADSSVSFDELIAEADAALRGAKQRGLNRVRTFARAPNLSIAP